MKISVKVLALPLVLMMSIPGTALAATPELPATIEDNDIPVTIEEVPKFYPTFSDIEGNMFTEEIRWGAENGYLRGWPDGTFRPQQLVTREAFAAFMYRMKAKPEAESNTDQNCFTDIANSQFQKEICWMKSEGISTGWPDGTYRPKEFIERGAIAAFFARADKAKLPEYYKAYAQQGHLPDAVGSPFYKEIFWFHIHGIGRGWDDGSFRPNAYASRDATAAFFYRYAHRSRELLDLPFPDPNGDYDPNVKYLEIPNAGN
ncbi:S-layer homology domain-containing protein [Boudabousia marimammalium]|uniref:SLH domain-containing protein n=1 Tax=Boudabousia marimammalium TaxID=156892 RepID=A0A1Q5PLY5_9ACTO|nr:S-layer homology domain-containing protein [Boudabousia marimammalium]OKL48050.1 hypothetical protein BM477_06165 [Boudabousia marimammalium]